jgi:hypothetical protein
MNLSTLVIVLAHKQNGVNTSITSQINRKFNQIKDIEAQALVSFKIYMPLFFLTSR